MRAVILGTLLLLPAALSLSACDDGLGLGDTVIFVDTLSLAAPTTDVDLPSAIDVTAGNALTRPELPSQAGQWDLQLRQQGAALTLAPAPAPDPRFRGAGLQETTRSFDAPGRAPRAFSEYVTTPAAVTVGKTYFVRSRESSTLFCAKFGIVKVLAVSADSGTARIAVRSNQNCDDERLEG